MELKQHAEDVKIKAIALATTLQIDSIVRDVAYNGKSDEAEINYVHTVENLVIRATVGAGTNSASVSMNEVVVYKSSNYGQRIEVFRFGVWVAKLIGKASEIRATNLDQERIEEEQKYMQMLDNFSSLEE